MEVRLTCILQERTISYWNPDLSQAPEMLEHQ